MSTEAKKSLVPKLRFPEFLEAWLVLPIGDKVELLSGYPFDGPDISPDNTGVPLLRGINVTEGRVRHSKEIDRYFTGPLIDLEKYRLKVDDLVIAMDGSKVGKNSALITNFDAGALLIQRVARLRVIGSQSIQFIFQLINSTVFHRYVDKINTSSGIPHISAKQIKEFSVAFPSLAEQQKISDCLSSLDELIAAQGRKVEALKTHKKGLMQQLFPLEGETQPRLRFPEFQDAGEWKETRLGKLGKLVSGLTYSPDDVREAGLLVLRSSNVQNSEITLDDCVYVDPSIKGANLSQPEDILICVRNGSKALIGKCALIPKGMPLCTHGAFMTVFRAEAPSFVFQLFQSDKYQKQVAGDLGATINSINGSQFLKYEFMVPKPAEQKRIADFLVSLDALITAANQELDTLKTHKKGLMQQLFPMSEAMES
jgi:restriction endonuclease S subunit